MNPQLAAASSAGMADFPLTPEQRQIVLAPPGARLLVTAGPGTGKTHTLVARLVQLVENEGLAPGDGILVLSFTRSAIRVLRERTRSAGSTAALVRSVTFDAFATRLLSNYDPDGDWTRESYDGRITAATELLRIPGPAREHLGACRHLLVDEVQDLVGPRAELVKALIDVVPGGFTLFGDPAQGIYDFQLGPRERLLGARALYSWIRDHFPDSLDEHVLVTNHRAQTPAASVALWAGEPLRNTDDDDKTLWYRLQEVLYDLPHLGDHRSVLPLLREPTESTALLCRTNGEALELSRLLHDAHVPHTLQRHAGDRAVAPWVGRTLQRAAGALLPRRRFAELYGPRDGEPAEPDAWQALVRLAQSGAGSVDLLRVAERLRRREAADDALYEDRAAVIVSTIHRAKGMEFDRVLLVENPSGREPEDASDLASESRILFVALTRPRRQLARITGPRLNGLHPNARAEDRWVRIWQRWRVREVEIRGEDVHADHPGGTFRVQGEGTKVQRLLAHAVAPGDEVALRLTRRVEEDAPRAYYAVEHREGVLGVTSERFAEVLHRVLKVHRKWRVNWPQQIDGLHVDFVDSVAGLPGVAQASGLGECGIYNRIRVAGLGRLRFNGQD